MSPPSRADSPSASGPAAFLCLGVRSRVNLARPCRVCVDCTRRTYGQVDGRQYLKPPPAKHDGKVWACEQQLLKAKA